MQVGSPSAKSQSQVQTAKADRNLKPDQQNSQASKDLRAASASQNSVNVEISEEAKNKPQYTEAELLEKIDFKNPTEKDLELYRDLVRIRRESGYYASGAASGKLVDANESNAAIAKRLTKS